jgi:hypothetical protein
MATNSIGHRQTSDKNSLLVGSNLQVAELNVIVNETGKIIHYCFNYCALGRNFRITPSGKEELRKGFV